MSTFGTASSRVAALTGWLADRVERALNEDNHDRIPGLAQLESRSMDETFLTVADIADQLRLNQQTVRNWIDRGELAAIRVGPRRVRVRASELERFISASSSAGLPDEAMARQEFEDALAAVQTNGSASELPAALRRLAIAANALARTLPGS